MKLKIGDRVSIYHIQRYTATITRVDAAFVWV